MKLAFRVLLAIFTLGATYFFVYWVPLSFIRGSLEWPIITNLIALAAGMAVGYFVWKSTGKLSDNLSRYVFLGGILTGTLLFLAGFFGPMIFTPANNQGPILGFILGPIGFVMGLLLGGLYWRFRKGKERSGLKS